MIDRLDFLVSEPILHSACALPVGAGVGWPEMSPNVPECLLK
jgi:hypothetical protein